MIAHILERLLLFVSLPIVAWSSHVTFDHIRHTGNQDSGVLAALPANGGWPDIDLDNVAIQFGGGTLSLPPVTVPAECDSSGVTTIEYDHTPGLASGIDEPGASAATRRSVLAVASGPTSITQSDDRNSAAARLAARWEAGTVIEAIDPKTPYGKWLMISYGGSDAATMRLGGGNRQAGESLALCFIGLLGISPSVLRRRGGRGGRGTGRRRKSRPAGGRDIG